VSRLEGYGSCLEAQVSTYGTVHLTLLPFRNKTDDLDCDLTSLPGRVEAIVVLLSEER